MQQRPFENHFTGYPDDERDLSGSMVPDAVRVPDPAQAILPGPGLVDGAALVREIAELRGRFEAAQVRILDELRNLREENERLEEENLRWKKLVGEYKQILNGR